MTSRYFSFFNINVVFPIKLQGNCIWTSSGGKRVRLTNTKLLDLSDVERKSLHRVAIQKLSEILKACKVPVSVPIGKSTPNKLCLATCDN